MDSISILGCGWLGLPFGKHLVEAGYRVKGSTTSRSKVDTLREAGIVPYIIELTPDIGSDTKDFFDTDVLLINLPPRNQNGVLDFHEKQLKAVRQAAKGNVSKVIFISSTAVYPAKNAEVTESDASSSCLSRGGVSLLNMEHLYSKDRSFQTTVIRFGGLYGPGRQPGRFLAGKKDLAGAANPINMIHLDDCIGIIRLLIEKNSWGEAFNASAPSKETRASYYTQAAIELGLEPPTFSHESAPFKKVSSEKLIRRTGYHFKH